MSSDVGPPTSEAVLTNDVVPAVQQFVERARGAVDENDHRVAIQDIRPLIRSQRHFYTAFLREALGLSVLKWSYKEKRRVSRALAGRGETPEVAEQADQPAPEAAEREKATQLAELFEDLVDFLHGDIDFGYSDESGNFTDFHEELFPWWLEAISEWLTARGNKDLAAILLECQSDHGSVAVA